MRSTHLFPKFTTTGVGSTKFIAIGMGPSDLRRFSGGEKQKLIAPGFQRRQVRPSMAAKTSSGSARNR